MKHFTSSLIFCALSAVASAAGAPAGRDYAFGMDDGCDSMRVTNYVLRDYLISLAHGCWTISFGHLEDCDEAYYNTNWGASGQCTFYPFSYPKRVFTALANLTKVLDKATCTRCLDVRGANAVYAVEFRRDRKTKDFATALWSASAHGKVALVYPAGAKVIRTGAPPPAAPKEKAYDAMDYVGEKDL